MSVSQQSTHCAVVIGVGAINGIGAAVCRRIAREGLLVYVVGRTHRKVETVVTEIQQAGGQAVAHILDATNLVQVGALFAHIASNNQIIDLTINIVGRNIPSRFLRTSTKFFDLMGRMTLCSDFLVSQQAIRAMLPHQKGTLIFTGNCGSLREKTSSPINSSGLRAYIHGIANEFKPSGIHVAHVIIDGIVDSHYINGFGLGRSLKRSLKELNNRLNIDTIADRYWQLHQQPSSLWTQEIDLRPTKEMC